VAIALFLATLVGLSLGLFGGGGSVLSVAILSLALDMPPKAAIPVSLLVIGVTSTAALIAQRGNGLVSIRTGVVFGAAGMVGAFAGGRLASLIPEAVLLTAFGVVMLLASLAMLKGKTASSEVDSWRAREESPLRVLRVLMLASTVGIVTGMLGAGGGFLIVPGLVLHGRMPIRRAVPTSLVVIALQSFAGFLGQLGHASLDWAIVVPFTLMATFGSVISSALSKRAPPELLRRGLAGMLFLVAIVVVVRELPHVRLARSRPCESDASRWAGPRRSLAAAS
jgi:uncharacterized membrane protein YfcA